MMQKNRYETDLYCIRVKNRLSVEDCYIVELLHCLIIAA